MKTLAFARYSVFSVIVLIMAACAPLSGDEDGAELATSAIVAPGTQALFVVGNTTLSAPDTALRNRLQSLGYTVVAVQAAASRAADATGKALVVISESVTSGDVNSKFRNVATPVLSLENALFDDMGMTGATGGVDFGEVSGQTDLSVVATSHPLAAGLTLTVTTSAQIFAFGKPAAGAIRIANIAANPAQAAIFGYETGQAMVGLSAPARRVGWFAGRTVPSALNKHGWNLFDAAVRWASVEIVCQAGQTRSCASGGLFGACAAGTEVCTNSGQWGACSIGPKGADSCAPGADENCNGIADEGCACISGSTQSCSSGGTRVCTIDGQWGPCSVP